MCTLHATSQVDAEPLAFLIWTQALGEDALSWGPGRSPGPAFPSPGPLAGVQPTGHLLLPNTSACPPSGALLLPFSCFLGFQVTARLSLPPEGPFQVTRSKWTPHAAPPRPS